MSADFEEWIVELHAHVTSDGALAAKQSGLVPNRSWNAGELIVPGGTLTHKEGGFTVRSRLATDQGLDLHVANLIELLNSPSVDIVRLRESASRLEVWCALYYGGNGLPEAWLKPNQLAFIAGLEAEVTLEVHHNLDVGGE
jgi:Domain of unknown function (DUF4279)